MDKLKKISWQWIAMLLMSVVILVLLFFPKSCGVDNQEEKIKRLQSEEKRKEAEAMEWHVKALKLEKKRQQDSVDRIVSEKKYLAKITALEKRAAEKRKAAEPIINRNDTVKQYVEALQAVNAAQAARINEQKEESRIQALVCRDLTGVQVKELGVIKSIDTDKDKIIKAQDKVIGKLKIGRVVRNVIIPVVAVGAFVLGVMAGN